MKPISARRWHQVRTALDELLELPDAEREGWLGRSEHTDAELVAELRIMLALQRDAGHACYLQEVMPPPLSIPTFGDLKGVRLGKYRLDSLIGEGGMGTVWTATRADGNFESRVAIKLLNAAIRASAAAHRFMREGRLLARLEHPNIARLLDADVSGDGTPYLVLEHIEGLPIDVYCDRHRLDLRARIRVFLGVLAAVEHSHMHLIVHRDIKPTNVLVTRDGTPKLLDFGIARLADVDSTGQELASARTQTLWGGRAMTPQCAAPEQLQGQAATTRSDVYGLGVLLYLLLTGRHPTGLVGVPATAYVAPVLEGRLLRPALAAQSNALSLEARRALAAARGTTPEKLRQQLRGDLDNILLKALKTRPAERYASASEFAHELRRYLEHRPVRARPDSPAYRVAKFVRRHRVATAASVVALLAVAAAAQVAVRNARRASFEAERASAVNAFVRDMFGVGKSHASPSVELRSTTVEKLLDGGTLRLAAEQDLTPEARVDLLDTLAEMYVGLGQPAKALPLLDRRLSLLETLPSGSPLDRPRLIAETLIKTASAAAQAGHYEQRSAVLDRAAPLVRELRTRAPDVFAHWSFEMAIRLTNVDSLRAAAAAAEAAAGFRSAGDTFFQVRALTQQVYVLTRASQYAQAESVLREAVRIVDAMQPRNAELAAYVNAAAGDLHFQWLRLVTAEQYGREELRAVIEAKGAMHPMTARAHVRLARTLLRRGKLAESVVEAEAAVAAAETSGNDDRRVLPGALESLGQSLAEIGRADAAAAQFERAASLWEPQGANGGLRVGIALSAATIIHAENGDLPRAEADHARMLAAMDDNAKQLGAQQIALATSALRAAQGRNAEAVALLEPQMRALDVDAEIDWNRVDLSVTWVCALTAAGDARAADALRAARELIARTPLHGVAPILEADLLLAEAEQLQAAHAPGAAERLRQALAIYAPRLSPTSPVFTETRSLAQRIASQRLAGT